MTIDTHNLAKLARISLTENEHVLFAQDIGKILSFIDTIQKVDVSTSDALNLSVGVQQPQNITRDDVVALRDREDCATDIISKSPRYTQNYIQVKKIL